jgi:hypothetical protein
MAVAPQLGGGRRLGAVASFDLGFRCSVGMRDSNSTRNSNGSCSFLADELLPTVDVIGRAGKRGVGHDVHGERRHAGRPYDPPDGERPPQLLAPGVETLGREVRRGQGVSTKPAAIRLTRTGARLSARVATNGGSAAVAADASPSRLIRRPPVPPMSNSVPPRLILPAALRATSSPSTSAIGRLSLWHMTTADYARLARTPRE